MGKLNYRIPNTNNFKEIYVKVTDTLPIGAVCQYGGSTAPSGYLMCNGQAVSRTTYADLFKAIGTSFGAGDGVTTFNVPNFNGRVPVGLDGTDTDFDTLGETGGEKAHTHLLPLGADDNSIYASANEQTETYSVTSGKYASWTGVTSQNINAIKSKEANSLQPYIVVNYIIKASKKVALDKGNVVDSLDGSDTDSAPSVRAVKEALVEEYSTDEVKTNKTWIDGKPIYRKVINSGAISLSTTNTEISAGITDADTITDINFMYKYSTNIWNKLWNIKEISYNTTNNKVLVSTTSSSSFTDSNITIEYTKTTDV